MSDDHRGPPAVPARSSHGAAGEAAHATFNALFRPCAAGLLMRSLTALSGVLLVACSSHVEGQGLCVGSSGCPADAACAAAPCDVTAGDAGAGAAWASAPVQVAAGREFSCLLDASGSVFCWGDNTQGQLGRDSTGAEVGVAGPVQGLPTGIVQVRAGDEHACVRTDSGEIWCWGENKEGQLGTGVVSSAESKPVKAGIAGPAVDLSVGGLGTCVALKSGEVQCWGHDFWRLLGRTSTQAPEPNPIAVAGVTDAVQVGTSGRHACVRQASGAVICWGSNYWGEVGRGTVSGVIGEPPGPVPDLKASDITLGVNHTCAVTDGGLVCWGDNRYGQIGDGRRAGGSPADSATKPTPVTAPPRAPFGAIGASGIDIVQASTCAIGDDGAGTIGLYCWGADQGGAFGDRQATPRRLPLTSPTAVSVGPKHACAIAGGRVYCWGVNNHGQLGDRATINSANPVAVVPP